MPRSMRAHDIVLGPHGIRANLVALANIATTRLNPEWYAETGGGPNTAHRLAVLPIPRSGQPQEVANVTLFLSTDQSSSVTGDRIIGAGGEYM